MTSSTYLKNIWSIRYFWLHLILSDIRIKYRHSLLGMGWALVQPLALTLLLTFVMGNFFKVSSVSYAPFIFSGLIFWDFIVSAAMTGCNAFINAEGYIKQFSHPLLIYTLRSALGCMINLTLAFMGLVIWIGYSQPIHIGTTWFILLVSFPSIFLFVWPMSTITAFISVKFRDLSQLMVILFQAIYFCSPILFQPQMFYAAKMGFLINYNPIYYLLNLFRKPLLEGQLPSITDFMVVGSVNFILWCWVALLIKRNEKKVIFYL